MENRSSLIAAQIERLKSDFQLHPVTATEMEFYLHGADSCASFPVFWENVKEAAMEAGILVYSMGKEDGQEQHEIAIKLCPDPVKTVEDTIAVKKLLTDLAKEHGMIADFSAKPHADRPGSGLHVHVHLTDTLGRNVFFKDDLNMSVPLKHSIGGMMAWMTETMPVFAPTTASYGRYVPKCSTPMTVSWGANNRTVAIRLPQSAQENKHIEHRVSGADADPASVMSVILAAMHYGLKNHSDPGPQIYGDASLPIYNLQKLPLSLEEAMAKYQDSKVVKEYFKVGELL